MATTTGTPYQRLSESDLYQIRLVRLFPGTSRSPIRCELTHISLRERDTGVHAEDDTHYLALPYCWGDVRVTKPITLGNHEQSFPVTANLFAFLRRFGSTLGLVCDALPDDSFLKQPMLQKLISQLLQGWCRWSKTRRNEAICSICSSFSGHRIWKPAQLKDLRRHARFLSQSMD